MPVFYRNARTGRVVRRDEPDTLMDRARRWSRIDEPSPAPETPREPDLSVAPEPSTRDMREWARGQGIEVPDRGRLPDDVIEAYRVAHG